MFFACCLLPTLLLLATSAACCCARNFRFAMALEGNMWEFGAMFHCNLARINLQNSLAQRHPDINVSNDFKYAPGDFTDQCHPQIEAWCKEGVDLIIGGTDFQFCLPHLAKLYPKVAFLATAGSSTGPPNYANAWMRTYQVTYLAGYTAGLMTARKKVCISAPFNFPAATMDLNGFCRGVHSADPTVEIHIFGTGQMSAPLTEVWIVNQSYALGCDVVWVQSIAIEGTVRASELGLMIIGHFTDARLLVGETVITSSIVDLTPVYIRAAEALLNGTFSSEIMKADWWMDWRWGAMHLADFSFLVPKDIQARVLAQVPTLDHVFCGRVCSPKQCLCNASTCCLTDFQLNTLNTYPDFVLDHGIVQLPGWGCQPGQLGIWHLNTFTLECSDCPAGTYAYNVDQTSECRPCPAATYSLPGATDCIPCPAGTYGDQPGQGQCTVCPAGSIAHNAASLRCSVCSSALSNSDRTQCATPSLLWLAEVGGGLAGGLVLMVVFLLWLAQHHGKRNNRAAPKDPSQAFCIVFTDIQGSTSLWAAIPEAMAVALDAHHRLIRKLLARYHCYEVKTIGDSFMCAAKGPAQALQFAVALQQEFVAHNWGSGCIDKAYTTLTPLNTTAPGCWRGLRVRVGIHHGQGDIKLDPVSKGYDYYGTVVNVAARIESVCHGGQIGVSEAVVQALGGHFPGAVITDLGLQQLRGLAEPIRLYQVLPEGDLSCRQFPPLRIDRADGKEEALAEALAEADGHTPMDSSRVMVRPSLGTSVTSSCDISIGRWADTHPLVTKGIVNAGELRRHCYIFHFSLAFLLKPLASGVRKELARELCSHFHVPNHGSDGPWLLRTLDALVKRTLPAAVVQRPEPRGSLLSHPPTVTEVDGHVVPS